MDTNQANAETCLQFTDVCGWTPDQWQERTVAVLSATLLTPVTGQTPSDS